MNNLPELLHDFIESRRRTPFAWGTNDCCIFSADWVLALTGRDLALRWRGTYQTEVGAIAHIKNNDGMRGFARELKQKQIGLAQRGNVVLADLEGRETFGVVDCSGLHYCAPGPDGLVFRPMSEAIAVFEV